MDRDSALRRRRARPVRAELATALARRGGALAKGWLLALVEDAPLEGLARLSPAGLARDAPALCIALAVALGSDEELDRLRSDGELSGLVERVAAVTGARSAAEAAAAVTALRAVLWAAALEELADPEAGEVSELAQRLDAVAAIVTATALGASASVVASPSAAGASDSPVRPRPVPDEGPEWLGALERQIEADERAGRRFSLLLFEIDDAARVVAAEGEDPAQLAFGRVVRAIRGSVRRPDIAAYEGEGRVWLIAAGTGRVGALALTARIAALAERTEPVHGAPLTLSAGFAVFPDEGRDAATLIERAEEVLFGARADGDGEPDGPGLRALD